MKECTSFEALLDLFADGELSPEEMARVQSHLDRCPACRYRRDACPTDKKLQDAMACLPCHDISEYSSQL